MKRNILFVDDEQNVLDGLRRMLRPLRSEIELTFANGGSNALELMVEHPFDVIVTDMRMPGMSGGELLDEVAKLHPQTVRIVLSGQSSAEKILQSLGPTHQYLSKPCRADKLLGTMKRALRLSELLRNEKVRGLVGQMGSVPSLPSLYVEIVKELNSADPSISRVSEIVSRDAAMTAKILQLVNSAFFGLRTSVSSPSQAIVQLGLDTVKALVLSAQVFSAFDTSKIKRFEIEPLTSHCLATGVLAKRIAMAEGLGQEAIDTVFTGGLLHDLGKLILAAGAPDEYADVLESAESRGIAVEDAEVERFGASHSEAGAYLIGLWGLPGPLIDVLCFHHCPSECPESGFGPVTAVHVADFLDQEVREMARYGKPVLETGHLAELGLGDRLDNWRSLQEA